MASFWKPWHCKFGSRKPAKVAEGLTNPHDIAEKFADMFEAACQSNSISANAYNESTFNSRSENYVLNSKVAPVCV